MGWHRITRGLDLPIGGAPAPTIEPAQPVSRVALLGGDYINMRPTFAVEVGEQVQRGQLLFEDKKTPGVRYTSPGQGRVLGIHRGERRAFLSIVIELDEAERSPTLDAGEQVSFASFTSKNPQQLTGDEIRALLVESGLWTSLRERPFGHVPSPETRPRSIFVTAMDTNPLAPPVDHVLKGKEQDFRIGLQCLAKLTDGPTFVCTAPNGNVPVEESNGIRHEVFEGPHPAGTPGVHIHTLDPVCRTKCVWYVNYQDVAAVGRLMREGVLDIERVIALAGPAVQRPRLLRTRLGTSLDMLADGQLEAGDVRVLSGSVLSGVQAMGDELGYLGRYHHQVTALHEGYEREFMAWTMPGRNVYSVTRAFLSAFLPKPDLKFTTTTHGGDRAIVPIGSYEKVMPMDIEPTYLLRSLVSRDVEQAELLGALELEEEDVALCSLVCAGKTDFGPILRENLTTLEKEG